MIKLGVNIDHIATLRNARGENHPNLIDLAKMVVKSGADYITVHLREDRRHIKDKDLVKLCKTKFKVNLEIASNTKMLSIALKNKPNYVCLVPEKRQEITTEGGLNLSKNIYLINKIVNKLNKANIRTSLFLDAKIKNIYLAQKIGAKCIEIHTGKLSRLVKKNKNYKKQLLNIKNFTLLALKKKIKIHAGHGLDFKTTLILKKNIKGIEEFNIGHFIIGESIKLGIVRIIKRFKNLLK